MLLFLQNLHLNYFDLRLKYFNKLFLQNLLIKKIIDKIHHNKSLHINLKLYSDL
jgi:hypothetical protein